MPLNSLQQLISSTVRSSDGYLILLQHSLQQRREMALEASDAAIYKRARVRTPAENAQRDFCGNAWLLHVASELRKAAKGLVWLETTGAVSILDDDSNHHNSNDDVTILNAASNPFGWDDKEKENEYESLTLENLPRLADAISKEVQHRKRPIVVESLTPIVMRHGLSRTMSFLRLLLKCNTTILVPILIETLASNEHVALEDLAQAVFYLHGGEMTMIRQGVRERGNVLRETIPFRIHAHEVTGKVSIEVTRKEEQDEEENVSESVAAADEEINDKASTTTATARPGKVKLEMEEDNAPPGSKEETTSRPHIYVQDNDPEFEDLDEEDPDDDLDI